MVRASVLLLLAAGCCAEPGLRDGREPPLEREARLWLEQGGPDPGPGNVLVSVERIFFDASQEQGIELLWRYAGRRVVLETSGQPWMRSGEAGEGFAAELKAMERSRRTRGKQTVSACALPGHEAELFLGEEEAFLPFVYAGRLVGASLERRRVGVSLSVRPRLSGEVVELDLFPRFSALDGSGALSLEEARTTLRARPGVPLLIGGGGGSSQGLDRWLFGGASREGVNRSVLVLTVRVGGRP